MANFFNGNAVWLKGQMSESFQHAVMQGTMTPAMLAQYGQTDLAAQMGVAAPALAPAFNQAAPAQNMIVPQYETFNAQGQRIVTNPYATLFKDGRTIMVNGVVEENMANNIVSQLLALESEADLIDDSKDPHAKDITLLINSPGGSVTAGMSIYDTMNFIDCDVRTICAGQAMSMGAFLLSAGAEGKRFALPSSSVMVHQPSAGTQGTVTDMTIAVKEFQRLKDYLNERMAEHTGKTKQEIEDSLERDNFMSAQDADAFNLVDNVIKTKADMATALQGLKVAP